MKRLRQKQIEVFPVVDRRYKYYIYEGKEYSSKELAKLSGIPEKTLWERIVRGGWTVEKAVSTPISRDTTVMKFNYKGKEYTLQELSKMSGMARDTLYFRIRNCKWDIEKAV